MEKNVSGGHLKTFLKLLKGLCISSMRMSDKERPVLKENRLRLNIRKSFPRLEE